MLRPMTRRASWVFRNAARWRCQTARTTRTFSIRKFTHICATCHVLYTVCLIKSMRVVVIILWFCTSMMKLFSSNVSTLLWNTSDLLISVCLHPLWLMSTWAAVNTDVCLDDKSRSLFCPSLRLPVLLNLLSVELLLCASASNKYRILAYAMRLQLVEAHILTRIETYQPHCHHMHPVEYRGKILCAYFNNSTKQKNIMSYLVPGLWRCIRHLPKNQGTLGSQVVVLNAAWKPENLIKLEVTLNLWGINLMGIF